MPCRKYAVFLSEQCSVVRRAAIHMSLDGPLASRSRPPRPRPPPKIKIKEIKFPDARENPARLQSRSAPALAH